MLCHGKSDFRGNPVSEPSLGVGHGHLDAEGTGTTIGAASNESNGALDPFPRDERALGNGAGGEFSDLVFTDLAHEEHGVAVKNACADGAELEEVPFLDGAGFHLAREGGANDRVFQFPLALEHQGFGAGEAGCRGRYRRVR